MVGHRRETLRPCEQSAQANQIVRRGGKGHDPINEFAAAMPQLAQAADRFHRDARTVYQPSVRQAATSQPTAASRQPSARSGFAHTMNNSYMAPIDLLTTSGLGSLLGMRHALEPDHLAAVTTLVAEERDGYKAAWLGACWGAGHT